MSRKKFISGADWVDVRLGNGGRGIEIWTRTRNRHFLPSEKQAVNVILPDGDTVEGSFNPHIQPPNKQSNPYISGSSIRQWIKSNVSQGTSREARLEEVSPGTVEVILIDGQQSRGLRSKTWERGAGGRSKALVGETRGRRKRTRAWAEQWERDPKLREDVLAEWGAECQVEGCKWVQGPHAESQERKERLVEVHHLHHVANGGSDDPRNVVLLCANHHRLVHTKGATMDERLDGADVELPGGPLLKLRRPTG